MPQVHGIIQAADEETLLSKVWCPKGGTQESALQGQQVIRATGQSQIWAQPRKGKKDKVDKDDKCDMENDKPSGSTSKSGDKAASQEQVLDSSHQSRCITESTSRGGHHKKSKKCGKEVAQEVPLEDTHMDTEAFEDA